MGRLKIIIAACLLTILMVACEYPLAEEDKTDNISKSIVNSKIEISMEMAIAISEKEADKYGSDYLISSVYSYDGDTNRNEKAGNDGKRQYWYVNFGNADKRCISILVCNGTVANVEKFDVNDNNGLFELSDIKITAEQAAKEATKLGLRGGNPENESEWVSGLNFNLQYSSLAETPEEEKLFFEVIGISPNGNFAHIDFDAKTGEVILTEEKIETSSGEIYWQSF